MGGDPASAPRGAARDRHRRRRTDWRAPGALRLGHYAHARWRPATPAGEAPAVAELFVGGEGLVHGPVNMLGTILQEAAHGIAATRGIKETSLAGVYHNKRFRALGEELGLKLDRHPRIGWSTTTVPPATAAAYAAEVEHLRAAIVHVRESEHQARHATPGGAARRRGLRRGRAGRGRRRALGTDVPVRLRAAAAAADGANGLRRRRRPVRRVRARPSPPTDVGEGGELVAEPLIGAMTLISYRGCAAAMAGHDGFYLAPQIAERPDGDPVKTFVCYLALYACDVLCGQLPGEPSRYFPARAERCARACLIPARAFLARPDRPDAELAPRHPARAHVRASRRLTGRARRRIGSGRPRARGHRRRALRPR